MTLTPDNINIWVTNTHLPDTFDDCESITHHRLPATFVHCQKPADVIQMPRPGKYHLTWYLFNTAVSPLVYLVIGGAWSSFCPSAYFSMS